jgi:aminoglycoside 6'-N-acetyltransferase
MVNGPGCLAPYGVGVMTLMQTLLHGTAVTMRPVHPDDAQALAAILQKREVARWWPGYDLERVRELLVEADDAVVFAIDRGHELVGSIQYVEEPAPDYRHASVDVFIDPAVHGEGLGTDAVRTLARHLLHDRGHHRLSLQPAADNENAIKAATRVGFQPVGVMRAYERERDGSGWRDCLLMDLLATDLT